MYDYKWPIQERAEQIALAEYDEEFHHLSQELQDSIYRRAMDGERDALMSRADYLRKRERERAKNGITETTR